MIRTQETPGAHRAVTATIGTGWDVRLAALHRGFAAVPGVVNPFTWFDFVAGRRARGWAGRKVGRRFGLLDDVTHCLLLSINGVFRTAKLVPVEGEKCGEIP